MLNAAMIIAYVILIPVSEPASDYSVIQLDCSVINEWSETRASGGALYPVRMQYRAVLCEDAMAMDAYLQHNKVSSDTWVLDAKTGKLMTPVQKRVMKKREIEELSHYDWSLREPEEEN